LQYGNILSGGFDVSPVYVCSVVSLEWHYPHQFLVGALFNFAYTVHVVVAVGKSRILDFLKFSYLLQYGNILTGGFDVSPV
jgi:hypothetical protein